MIKSLKFDAHHTGWHLRGVGDGPAEFGPLQLLVGLSGAGKSRTLSAIRVICQAATGHNQLNDCKWSMEFEAAGHHMTWHAKTDTWSPSTTGNDDLEIASPRFLIEELFKDGELLLSRSSAGLTLHGQKLPRLKDTESAISLFRDEESIKPAFDMFTRLEWIEAGPPTNIYSPKNLEELLEALDTISEPSDWEAATFRNALLPIYLKAHILNQEFPKQFQELTDRCQEIFPTVTELGVGLWSDFHPQYGGPPALVFAIREQGISDWIVGPFISQGMLTTLLRLVEDIVGANDTVRLIDEVENSLGVNCLDAVAETLHPTRGRQTIATSHHPYIIGNISPKHWLVVQRKGDTVHLIPATSIPRLQTASHQDLFTQLINTPEYLEGIR